VAAVAAVFFGVFFFGLVDFMTPFTLGEEWSDHYLVETGWGLLYLVMVTVPLLVLVARPGLAVALAQLMAVAVAVASSAVLAGSPAHALPGVGIAMVVGTLVALSPVHDLALPPPARVTAVVAAAGAVPAAGYAWAMARASENPELTWGLDHYPAQAALAISVVLVALLAAWTVAGPGRAWRLPVGTVAFSAVWLGWQSVVWSERAGTLGSVGGVAAIVWGLALLAAPAGDALLRGSRRTAPDEESPVEDRQIS
jgi:hypothetical protein